VAINKELEWLNRSSSLPFNRADLTYLKNHPLGRRGCQGRAVAMLGWSSSIFPWFGERGLLKGAVANAAGPGAVISGYELDDNFARRFKQTYLNQERESGFLFPKTR